MDKNQKDKYVPKENDMILIVPCTAKGRGGGHLIRSALLVRDLRQLGREAFLFINERKNQIPIAENLALAEGFNPAWIIANPPEKTALVIIDGFRTSRADFGKWNSISPVLGIDEGGRERKNFDFLIDLLPGLDKHPNLLEPYFLPKPKRQRRSFSYGDKTFRILVSFGAEDAAGLGFAANSSLARFGGDADITFLNKNPKLLPPTVISSEKIPSLRDHLADYDLLITHYGLTAFEALFAKLPVLLVSPTKYHAKLAKNAGFISTGRGKTAARRAGSLVFSKEKKNDRVELNYDYLDKIADACQSIHSHITRNTSGSPSLAEFLLASEPHVSRHCRVCGSDDSAKMIARFPRRTYRRCKNCGLIYMERLDRAPIEYGEDYFFDLYKKQYGKTYFEDFPSLVEAGKRRLKKINALLPAQNEENPHRQRLLDIGCAYGPFLEAARESGFFPEGIEPAEDAVDYVREELKLPCVRGFFREGIVKGPYDAITLWYVIEHFEDPGAVLDEINRIMKYGGVLAFSTPSFRGISGRKSLIKFLKASPEDHWSVWSPAICAKILASHGFTLKKIVNTGHHPERFPHVDKNLKKNSGMYRFLMRISRSFKLGDSFEVYAVKNN